MSDLTKLKISRILYSTMFWIPIGVLYFQYRGFSLSTMYLVVSTSTFLQVILEYPTGVIGDYFGHKASVFLGYIFTGIAFILVSLALPIWAYFVSWGLLALGGALVSGSDTALLYSVSKDFKKDSAWIASVTGISYSISLVLGSLLAKVNMALPVFLCGATTLISAFIILSVKNKSQDRREGDNVFSTAKRGLIEVNTNKKITFLIYSSAVLLMYGLSQKWVQTPIFERANIPIEAYGILFAVISLIRSQAGFLYRKFGDINNWILLTLFILLSLLLSFNILAIPSLVLIGIVIGYYQVQSDIVISENVDASVRASSLSYRGLLNKLLETGFLAVIGSILLKTTFPTANIYATGILVLLIIVSFVISSLFKIRK